MMREITISKFNNINVYFSTDTREKDVNVIPTLIAATSKKNKVSHT